MSERTNEAAAGGASEMLRTARETAGLTIDQVSQHLKLHPRQVKALEEGDYAQLPGRTFVRGFARNYARLLQLDPDAVIGALPDSVAAPALDRPAIGATHGPIGELPVTDAGRRSNWTRWAIPLVLLGIVGGAAVYEYLRQTAEPKRTAETRTLPMKPAPIEPAPAPTPIGTPLPNPLATAEPAAAPAPAPGAAMPATPPEATGRIQQPAATGSPAAPAATGTTAPASGPAPAPGDATLVIAYRNSAWTEVRDRTGKVVLQTSGKAGAKETVTGAPPFDVVIGNATDVSLTWRDVAFDLAPHIKQNNIARARLP